MLYLAMEATITAPARKILYLCLEAWRMYCRMLYFEIEDCRICFSKLYFWIELVMAVKTRM